MPKTLHLNANDAADIERAAKMLREGRLVAFATETVYGLGANALSAEAVRSIFAAKQRPSWDPVIVHLASGDDVEEMRSVAVLEGEVRERVQRLAAAFWPGPLTMLVPRTAAVPDEVTAGRPLVGVRVPSHPAAQALLRAAKIPVAAPSANRFGHTSPTTAAHVLADLEGCIDAVLDAGPATVGLESTVLDVTQTPMVVYRPGAVSAEQMEAVCGIAVRMFVAENDAATAAPEPEALPSPGVGIRHYAPRARLVLVEGSPAEVCAAVHKLAEEGQSVGVLLPETWSCDREDAAVWRWAAWGDAKALGAGLYAGMRALDEAGVAVMVCPLPEPGGLRDAIRDRLQKAARSE